MSKKLTIKEFIEKSKKVHRDNYDYSKTEYINSLNKVSFKCIKHDIIVNMLPYNHLQGKGCLKCAKESVIKKNTKTKEKFIEEANLKYDNKYDYSLVDYKNAKIKVKIICPKHGVFEQTPDGHLSFKGCKLCSYIERGKKQSKGNENFIKECNLKHNFKYDYSKVNYVNEDSILLISCPIHGQYEQRAANHLKGQGCRECGNLATSEYQKENSNGWSIKTWVKSAEKSKVFDSFKVYIIECYNENEKFYKIGRTFVTTEWRFRYKTQLPYKFNILKEIIGTAENVFNLELKLKKQLKDYKYLPLNKFDGMYECFSHINDINDINI